MALLDEILDAICMRGAPASAVMERVRYWKRAEDLAAQAVNLRSERDRFSSALRRIAERVESTAEGAAEAVDRLATAFNDAKMRIVELEHALSFEQLTAAHHYADLVTIVQMCGGDVEDGTTARECVERVLAERAAAPVCDARRLKLREGWTQKPYESEDGWVTVWRDPNGFAAIVRHSAHSFTAIHVDDSETDHATRLEAHDALIASGSDSPFEVVTGPAVKS